MIVIKGKNTVLEALYADIPIHEILLVYKSDHLPEVKQIVAIAHKKRIKVSQVSNQDFQSVAKDKTAQHILAFAQGIPHVELTQWTANPDENPILVMTDHLEDPHNFGAIIRTAFALGASGVIYPKDRQVGLTGGVMKASSGAVYHIPLCKTTNLANAVQQLKQAGYWVYGTDVRGGAPLPQTTLNLPCVILVGNEKKGLSKRLSDLADQNIYIPMKGDIDSLNVSVATGILLYTASQQLSL